MKPSIARFFLVFLLAVTLLPASSLSQEHSQQKPTDSLTSAESKDDTGKAGQNKDKKDGVLQIGTNLVSMTVSVTDPYGRFVTGLSKEHFEIFDEKVKQQIDLFTDEDSPVSIGVIYDVSGSMKERIARSVRAVKRFIETSHDDDDFFLIGFNDRAKLVHDFTTSGDQLVSHLMFVQPKGSTALYDAAYLAVEKVKQGRHTKKALLIISDGQDNHSRYTYKELRNLVKEADVQI